MEKEVDKIFELKNSQRGNFLLKCKSATWGDAPNNDSYEYRQTNSRGMIVPDDLIID